MYLTVKFKIILSFAVFAILILAMLSACGGNDKDGAAEWIEENIL